MKKITTRTGKVTKKVVEQLRAKKIASARNKQELRFFKSKSFDTLLRKTVRNNRLQRNIKTFSKLENALAKTRGQKKSLARLFGERTNSKGKTTNRYETLSATRKLNKAIKDLKLGKLNLRARALRLKDISELVRNELKIAGNDVLGLLESTDFYLQNKQNIIEYNKISASKGKIMASKSSFGKKVTSAYNAGRNEELKAILDKL